MNNTPPSTIFYSETGGKGSPFYSTLKGIKSAFKTTWGARHGWNYRADGTPKVFRGEVNWVEINPETGLPVDPNQDTTDDRFKRMIQ